MGIQNRYLRRSLVLAFSVGVIAVLAVSAWRFSVDIFPHAWLAQLISGEKKQSPHTVIFSGDVFLGRQTEEFVYKYKLEPFKFLRDTFTKVDTVVINFESAVAKPHIWTKYYTFDFSTAPSVLPLLEKAGVTHASLANNHAYDYGKLGYEGARASLAPISTFGHPYRYATSTVAYEGDTAFVGINITESPFDAYSFATLLQKVSASSTQQVIYVHWGEEYAATHNKTQEWVARSMVVSGADLIVGHHPHVVQDMQIIDGVPVFYSLGNTVFDQYFSADVQRGLLLLWVPDIREITLLPISTVGHRMQPALATGAERIKILQRVAGNNSESLQEQIYLGTVRW